MKPLIFSQLRTDLAVLATSAGCMVGSTGQTRAREILCQHVAKLGLGRSVVNASVKPTSRVWWGWSPSLPRPIPDGRTVIGILLLAACCLSFGREALGQTHPPPAPTAAREYQAGKILFDERRYEAAAVRFSKATALDPANSLYSQWLGRAYGLEAQSANLFYKPRLAVLSREALEKAVALDPENLGARSDLAAFYQAAPAFMGGGLDKARVQVAEIRKRDPYMGQVRAGDLLQDENHLPESEQAYLAAVAIDARRPEAHERLGFIYQESSRYPQAFAQWDLVLHDNPTQHRALYGLGKTAAVSGQRLSEGEAALRKFLSMASFDPDGPSLAHGHYYLGSLAAKRSDRDAANKEYTEALHLDPQLKDAAQARAALQ